MNRSESKELATQYFVCSPPLSWRHGKFDDDDGRSMGILSGNIRHESIKLIDGLHLHRRSRRGPSVEKTTSVHRRK